MPDSCMNEQTIVQLHIHASQENPFRLKQGQNGHGFIVRVTATEMDEKISPLSVEKEVSLTIIRGSDYITVSAKDHNEVYNEKDFLIYTTSTQDASCIELKIDVYNASKSAIGYGYVPTPQINESSGSLMVALVNKSSQYVGTISVDYLLTNPWYHPQNLNNGEKAILSQGISAKKINGQPFLCGHRGAGESFKGARPSIYPENTISAFKAASAQGIDFVEMDVQVSKDKIPVVFHDGTAKLSLQSIEIDRRPAKKTKTESGNQAQSIDPSSTYLEVPIKDLTIEQMQSTKVFGIPEFPAYQSARSSSNTALEDFNLFPTLKEVFDKVPEETGLIMELKYPLQEMGGENVDYQRMDENEFVDLILQVVFENARDRKVVLASFDANICFMCQMKQSTFPVFFITQDDTSFWNPYLNLRTRHIDIAIGIAKAFHLAGVHTFSHELVKAPERIKKVLDADLILSVWGEMNEDPKIREWLDAQGVHCIQIDRVFDVKQAKEGK